MFEPWSGIALRGLRPRRHSFTATASKPPAFESFFENVARPGEVATGPECCEEYALAPLGSFQSTLSLASNTVSTRTVGESVRWIAVNRRGVFFETQCVSDPSRSEAPSRRFIAFPLGQEIRELFSQRELQIGLGAMPVGSRIDAVSIDDRARTLQPLVRTKIRKLADAPVMASLRLAKSFARGAGGNRVDR